MKTVGSRSRTPASPTEAIRRAERIIAEAHRLAPMAKPRGFILKFKTHQDYEQWRASQTNPRFW